MVNRYHSYTQHCPFCWCKALIRWGYYFRTGWPDTQRLRIQRVCCKTCGRTTNVLPSFLLAYKSYSVSALEQFIATVLKYPPDWIKWLDSAIELATAQRWLKQFKSQIQTGLPLIYEKLFTFQPHHPVMTTVTLEPLNASQLIERFLTVSTALHQVVNAMIQPTDEPLPKLFCFLNFFLYQNTGHGLLVT